MGKCIGVAHGRLVEFVIESSVYILNKFESMKEVSVLLKDGLLFTQRSSWLKIRVSGARISIYVKLNRKLNLFRLFFNFRVLRSKRMRACRRATFAANKVEEIVYSTR